MSDLIREARDLACLGPVDAHVVVRLCDEVKRCQAAEAKALRLAARAGSSVADTVAAQVRATLTLEHVNVDPDRELLRRALLALRPSVGHGPRARWALVGSALRHGAGVSLSICHALGINPDEVIDPDRRQRE